MSDITDKLRAARQRAWPSLVPVYDWALVIAAEMEYAADQASVVSQTHCSPAYPPAVELLAASCRPAPPGTHPSRAATPGPGDEGLARDLLASIDAARAEQ